MFWKKVIFKTYRHNVFWVPDDLEQSKKKLIELSWEISFVRNVRFDKKLSFGLILLTYTLFCFYSSDIVRRPQKSEKITHFVLTLLRSQNFQKSWNFFSNFLAFSQYMNFIRLFSFSLCHSIVAKKRRQKHCFWGGYHVKLILILSRLKLHLLHRHTAVQWG